MGLLTVQQDFDSTVCQMAMDYLSCRTLEAEMTQCRRMDWLEPLVVDCGLAGRDWLVELVELVELAVSADRMGKTDYLAGLADRKVMSWMVLVDRMGTLSTELVGQMERHSSQAEKADRSHFGQIRLDRTGLILLPIRLSGQTQRPQLVLKVDRKLTPDSRC